MTHSAQPPIPFKQILFEHNASFSFIKRVRVRVCEEPDRLTTDQNLTMIIMILYLSFQQHDLTLIAQPLQSLFMTIWFYISHYNLASIKL